MLRCANIISHTAPPVTQHNQSHNTIRHTMQSVTHYLRVRCSRPHPCGSIQSLTFLTATPTARVRHRYLECPNLLHRLRPRRLAHREACAMTDLIKPRSLARPAPSVAMDMLTARCHTNHSSFDAINRLVQVWQNWLGQPTKALYRVACLSPQGCDQSAPDRGRPGVGRDDQYLDCLRLGPGSWLRWWGRRGWANRRRN